MADKHFQLLVHAGAPSTRQDDRRYTAQAEAYFSLLASRGRRVENDARMAEKPDLAFSSHGDAQHQQPNQITEPATDATIADATVYLEDTQLAYTALESQLRSSTRPVERRTPATAYSHTSRIPATATPSGRCTPGIDQSSYLISPQLARFRQVKGPHDLEPAQKLPRLVRKPNIDPPTGHHDAQRTDGSDKENSEQTTLEDVELTSELPTSYSLSASASAGSSERVRLPQKSASDPGLLDAGLAESIAKTMSPAKSLASPGNARGRHISKASEVQVFPHKRLRTSADVSGSGPAKLQGLSSEILPPAPETSVNSFKSHVTPALQHLVENPALAAAFKPIAQTRQLQASERGHWFVQCQGLSTAEHVSFWESLERSIENAGWGVWCTQGRDHQLPDSPFSKDGSQDQALGSIRHVYLLLYVASKSKVRRLGLQWIDSDGRIVVQMR
ncbi:hypothetical protein PRZ48_001197 [Zasmidium cellare]|uniref:Uncharacterized protein n=1 Tax=Zasmidium cellare TaxID=395010 RepID=A0ABR0F0L3_ZASCE|nr:hypothetical protein PRZ48_001197 [Zasmidium cellare]